MVSCDGSTLLECFVSLKAVSLFESCHISACVSGMLILVLISLSGNNTDDISEQLLSIFQYLETNFDDLLH